MSGFKDIMKNGWHPEKSGSSLKGSVSNLMGRGKDSTPDSSNHVARPLSDLKDPASFAPPPRRTGSGLAPAPPSVSTKRKVITSPSNYMDPRADPVEPPPRNTGVQAIEAPPASRDEEPQPPMPYRVNTTGLSTQHLPKPPARRDEANGSNPPPYSEAAIPTPAPKALPPSLPPRLPPRGATSSPAGNEQSNGLINQGSINRLGAAGVSVPSLGIGRGLSANTSSPSPAAQHSAGRGSGKLGSQVNELPRRFANMGNLWAASPAQEPPAQGTTWAQKQAALKTASNFHKDPSSVSFSDAKTAATTANNFRQRHGEQVASGIKTANNLNKKYGVMDKVGTYTGSQTTHAQPRTSPPVLPGPGQACTGYSSENSPAAPSGVAGKKKPPPPPPPKKKLVAAAPAKFATHEDEAPPPIPVSTRPAF